MTTQTPRWDVGPDETVIEDSARSADEPPQGAIPLQHLDWRLVAAIVGGLVVILGSFTSSAISWPVTSSRRKLRSPASLLAGCTRPKPSTS